MNERGSLVNASTAVAVTKVERSWWEHWYRLACLMVFVSDSQLYGCWLTPCKMLRVLCHKMSRHSFSFTLSMSLLFFSFGVKMMLIDQYGAFKKKFQRRGYRRRKTAFVWETVCVRRWGSRVLALGTVHKHMTGTKSTALGRNPNRYGYKALSLKIYSLLALRIFRLLFTASELLFSLSLRFQDRNHYHKRITALFIVSTHPLVNASCRLLVSSVLNRPVTAVALWWTRCGKASRWWRHEQRDIPLSPLGEFSVRTADKSMRTMFSLG